MVAETSPEPIDAAPRAAYETYINAQRRNQARGAGVMLNRYPKWDDLAPCMKMIWMGAHAANPIAIRGSSVEDLIIPMVAGLFEQCCRLRHDVDVLRANLVNTPTVTLTAEQEAVIAETVAGFEVKS